MGAACGVHVHAACACTCLCFRPAQLSTPCSGTRAVVGQTADLAGLSMWHNAAARWTLCRRAQLVSKRPKPRQGSSTGCHPGPPGAGHSLTARYLPPAELHVRCCTRAAHAAMPAQRAAQAGRHACKHCAMMSATWERPLSEYLVKTMGGFEAAAAAHAAMCSISAVAAVTSAATDATT